MSVQHTNQDNRLAKQVELLYVNVAPALISSVVVAVIVAITSYFLESGLNGFFWMTSIVLASAARGYTYVLYRREELRADRAKYWDHLFVLGCFGSGFFWGLSPWVMFLTETLVFKFFLYSVLTALCAVSLSIYSYRFRAYAAFTAPIILLTAVEAYRHGDLMAVYAGLSLLTGIVLLRISWRYQLNAMGMLELDAEKAGLTAKLSDLGARLSNIRNREARASATLDEASIMPWMTDQDNNLTEFAQRFKDHTGVSMADIIGHSILSMHSVLTPDSPDYAQFTKAISGRVPFRDLELHVKCINGSQMIVLFSGKPILNPSNEFCGFEGYARDITASSSTIRDLTHKAKHDPLTGVINRQEFGLRVSQFVPPVNLKGKVPHVVYIDLQRLKVINDNLGLSAGDEMLCQLVETLVESTRNVGVVSRLGGSALGVLLEPGELAEALDVVTDAIVLLNQHRMKKNGFSFSVSAKAGVVGITPLMDTAEEVISCADLACRNVDGDNGKRISVYHENMTDKIQSFGSQSLAKILNDLEQKKLRLQYQPLLDLRVNRVAWFEALLSTESQDGTVSMIGKHLIAAEQHGEIERFDRWAIDAALSEFSSRGDELGGAGVTVNVSPHSICHAPFAQYVLNRLDHYGFPAEKLCLELTETSGMGDLIIARKNFAPLSRRGCLLSLDDFGTGSSSLEYLKYLPASFLKVNHVFLSEVRNNEIDQIICQTIIELGSRTGCRIIAESVEDVKILPVLRQLGIHYAQGYAIGKPGRLPAAATEMKKVS